MPPRRRFNKKEAKTFQLVHRAHDDALFYDNDASEHVLVPAPSRETKTSSRKKIYKTSDLEKQLGSEEIRKIRENEGLAAQYGIFFDDSKYDYMQHLKPIGQNNDAVFVERKGSNKEKEHRNIEDLFEGQVPSKEKVEASHALEDIPEELRGFKPDMDPRLREILEALEDEAYITEGEEYSNKAILQNEEEQDDIFSSILKSGRIGNEEFYENDDIGEYGEDYDEWDLDNYVDEYDRKYDSDNYEEQEIPYNEGQAPEELLPQDGAKILINNAWEKDFNLFKMNQRDKANDFDSDSDLPSELDEDTVPELPNIGTKSSKKKASNTKTRKKKGAMTDTSSFSMSSSALFRTEGLTLLDDKYEQMTKKFEKEEEDNYEVFNIDKERTDLNDMLDDFLENFELEGGGRKLVRKSDEKQKIQEAADSVSLSKLAARRKKERTKREDSEKYDPLGGLGASLGGMSI